MHPLKLSWNLDSPAPFESSWMIFSKIMMLNYLKPPLIWDVITNHPSDKKKDKKLLLHNSRWIDFEQFSAALGVKPNRLRKGFLDQLGFPGDLTDIANGIRFCPECLAKGYHCSFFNLSLINACPWHGHKLLPACKECVKAIEIGLKREIGEGQDSDHELAASGGNLIYKSNCGHLRYVPQLTARTNGFSLEEESGINVACNSFLQWWYRISASQHPYASFAKRLFNRWLSDDELESFLEVACEIAGPCPWPLRLSPRPVGYCEWRQVADQLQLMDHEAKQNYYRTIYRSVRRHIFRRYLRKHRNCVAKLMSLTNYEEQYLISSTICPLALAYISWRTHMERNNVLTYLRLRGRPLYEINSDTGAGVHDFEMTKNPNSLAHTWLIEFFSFLDMIEGLIDKTSFDIYRWDYSLDKPKNVIYEFVPADKQPRKNATGLWLALSPKAEFLIKRGEQRCASKLDSKYISSEMYTIDSLSLLNYRPQRGVLFRVINFAEQRKNFAESYAYREHHYFLFARWMKLQSSSLF